MVKTPTNKELQRLKSTIVGVLKDKGITQAGIFGSFARGDQKKGSDIDILIKPTAKMSLLDLVGLEYELKNRLKRNVDLLTYNGISHFLKERILKEEVRIL